MKTIFVSCFPDDPSVYADEDFISADDVSRMRRLLRKIDSADRLLSKRLSLLLKKGEAIRRGCACRA